MTVPPLHRGNVAVVVPALNEALRIAEVVGGALEHCDHVIVVDDGSDDATADIVSALPVTLLRHPQRQGKGAALRAGFAEARRRGFAAVVTMDGDGQHRASDIPRLIEAANRHPNCIVNGARLKKRSTQPWYRRLGNDFGDWGIAWGCGYRLVDSQSGQRLYPAGVLALQDVPGEGFVFEAQILISAARELGCGVVSVPVETRYRSADSDEQFRKSHFRLFHDLYQITSHVVGQVLSHGDLADVYRRRRRCPPVIFDPGMPDPEPERAPSPGTPQAG
ncbi:glycosyltransferase family 2 protein [Luteimonas sp. FCS-9]|uniref:glycosyltransferase family 2 protein n=1 Tax=Luteimonas sp. FCS-9 TaxID=1547516 RepID=UPI00063EC5AF|nr:glycosyltransferase family 2 protein [Luteimonas sp. FCS-9]KLI98085.1 dolichyl-phosphate mannose synthase [Luteimonas sp. FCS-9]